MVRGVYIPASKSPLPTRFTSFLRIVPRPPVRLYIFVVAYERAIPLACVLALNIVDEFSDCPLGIWCGSPCVPPGYVARLCLPSPNALILHCPSIALYPVTRQPFGVPYLMICPGCCKCASCPVFMIACHVMWWIFIICYHLLSLRYIYSFILCC